MHQYDIHIDIDEETVADSEAQVEETIEDMLRQSCFSTESAEITVTDQGERTVEGPKAVLNFSPQKAQGNGMQRIVSIDPLGETTFIVPLSDVLDEDGRLYSSPSHALDRLKDHELAPMWIRNHSGPFDLRIDHLKDLPEGREPQDYDVAAKHR